MPPVETENGDASTQPPPRVERKSAEQWAEERRDSLTRRLKDGSWTKKNSKSYFGFKLHTIQGVENDMIVYWTQLELDNLIEETCLHRHKSQQVGITVTHPEVIDR